MNKEILIGSHVGMNGPDFFLGTCKTAINWGENTFMFYTGAPQNSFRAPTSRLKISEGLAYLKENNVDITKVIVHAPYIINLANTVDESKFEFGVSFLIEELSRCKEFGIKTLVLHPGSAVGGDIKEGLDKICAGLDLVFAQDNSDVIIALETMAGKGHELGRTFEEVAYIIEHTKHSNRLGVCLDTCHLNDAGYVVDDIENILDQFDKIIGLDRLKVIHLNDSKNELGSHKDRHENIGFGTIGFDTLVKYINHPKLIDIPKILETPYVNEKPPYKEEILMLKSGKMDHDLKNKL